MPDNDSTKAPTSKVEGEECPCGLNLGSGSPVPINYSIRKMCIFETITANVSKEIIQGLEIMALEEPNEPIEIWLNSPGGHAEDAFAIYDMMRYVPCPVHTVGIGKVMSAALILLAGGDSGCRSVFPSTRLMFHQLSYGQMGTLTDMSITHQEAKSLQGRMLDILTLHTNLERKELEKFLDANKDLYITAQKAKTHGFIDFIRKGDKPTVQSIKTKKKVKSPVTTVEVSFTPSGNIEIKD